MVRMPLRIIAATVVAASFALITTHSNALVGPPRVPISQPQQDECHISPDGKTLYCIDRETGAWYWKPAWPGFDD